MIDYTPAKDLRLRPLEPLPIGYRSLHLFRQELYIGRYHQESYLYYEKFLLTPVKDPAVTETLEGVVIEAYEL